MQQDDIIIFEHIKAGDEAAFKRLFDRYHQLLFMVADQLLDNTEEAQDVVQELFIRLWAKRASLVVHTAPRAYLLQAIKNNCMAKIRDAVVSQKRKRLILQQREKNPMLSVHPMESAELGHQIQMALNQVTPARRIAFEKSYVEGKSITEIAKELNSSVFTVKNNIARALITLRKNLKSLY